MLVQYSSTEQKRIRNRKQHKLCSGEGCTNQTLNLAVCRYCKPKKGGSPNPEIYPFPLNLRTKEAGLEFTRPRNAGLALQGFMLNAVLAFSSDESAMTYGKSLPTVDQESWEGLLTSRL